MELHRCLQYHLARHSTLSATNPPPSRQHCLCHPWRVWYRPSCSQTELAEESKAEAVAQALKAAGKTTIPVPRGNGLDKGNTDQGAAKKEREQKLHRLTRKKRRRILAREADERQAKEEAEELKAQGGFLWCSLAVVRR